MQRTHRQRCVKINGCGPDGATESGCYRVDPCVGSESEPDGVWREPAYLVHNMDREEAIAFGRVFRQNTILYAQGGRPELIITDPTADDIGRTFQGNWRLRS